MRSARILGPVSPIIVLFLLAELMVLYAMLPSSVASAQTVTEIINARHTLRSPGAVAVDGAGNVFVAGGASSNVFKITPRGVITEIIDETGDGAGNTLSIAGGIAVDGSGNVFVAGFGSENVLRRTPGGVITEIIDETGDGSGNAFFGPGETAVDRSGNVFVAGTSSNNVFKITPGGVITEIIDGTGDGSGNTLIAPTGIAVDESGNVFVTGRFSHNAFKITFPVENFIRGDSDGDGEVALADAIRILDILFGDETAACRDQIDVNDNGVVAIPDAMQLLFWLFVAGGAPAPPFPACGADPTADSLDCLNPPECP